MEILTKNEVDSFKSIFCPLPRNCGWYGYLDDCVYHIKRNHMRVMDETRFVNVIHRQCKSFLFKINVSLRLKTSIGYENSLFIPWIALMSWCGSNFIFHCTYKKYDRTYYIGVKLIGTEEESIGLTFCIEAAGDHYLRNYGPFPIKSIDNGSYNETDLLSITATDIQTLYKSQARKGVIRAFRLTCKIKEANEVDYEKAIQNFQLKDNFQLIKRLKKGSNINNNGQSQDSPSKKQILDPLNPLSLITSSSARCFALPSFHSTFKQSCSTTSEDQQLESIAD